MALTYDDRQVIIDTPGYTRLTPQKRLMFEQSIELIYQKVLGQAIAGYVPDIIRELGTKVKDRVVRIQLRSWNARGMGADQKKEQLKNYDSLFPCDCTMVQETKSLDLKLESVFDQNYQPEYTVNHAQYCRTNHSMGFALLYDRDSLIAFPVVNRTYCQTQEFVTRRGNYRFMVVNFYCRSRDKPLAWQEVNNIAGVQNVVVAVMGDFNATMYPHEKLNYWARDPNRTNLVRFVADNNLWEPTLLNAQFTCNGKSKIDRIYFSTGMFDNTYDHEQFVQHVNVNGSDHEAIVCGFTAINEVALYGLLNEALVDVRQMLNI